MDISLCIYVKQIFDDPVAYRELTASYYNPPATVHFYRDQYFSRYLEMSPVAYEIILPDSKCPPTHFQCPSVPYRLPVFLRCNGVYDCPYKEDEDDCDTYTCPGYFRCRQSRVCVHPDQVCDGRRQCPQYDDEWYCALTCPDPCLCQGQAFTCFSPLSLQEYTHLRYLDASGSGLKAESLCRNTMLVYLNLTNCSITELLLPVLPNVKILDVSSNLLAGIFLDTLKNVSNLNHLVLANNPLTSVFPSGSAETWTFPRLTVLDLASVEMARLDLRSLQPFPGLLSLNLSGSHTRHVSGESLHHALLSRLDVRGCAMTSFPHALLKDLDSLAELHADDFKLCCVQALPEHFSAEDCHGPAPVFSSCERLLGAAVQRILLYLLALLTLLGNGLLVALLLGEGTGHDSVKTFVLHLCGCKLLMGVYLCAVCVGDQAYGGSYLWDDTGWRSGVVCQVLACVFLLACQVSVFTEVSMTLERCVVLTRSQHPMSDQRRRKATTSLCIWAWLAGVCLSVVPSASRWTDFSQTSLCVPLPVAAGLPGGHPYAFSLLVAVNCGLMVLTVAGQIYITTLIHTNTLAFFTNHTIAPHLTAARRLTHLVVTDACCWFGVTLWAVLTSQGMWVPADITYSVSVFFIFVSSALTPYLYLLGGVLERRREVRRRRVLKRLALPVKHK
ncbi:hypothetical protein ACOMHN_052865 [Nucella lapillus]